jgi:hypothetical protein
LHALTFLLPFQLFRNPGEVLFGDNQNQLPHIWVLKKSLS